MCVFCSEGSLLRPETYKLCIIIKMQPDFLGLRTPEELLDSPFVATMISYDQPLFAAQYFK